MNTDTVKLKAPKNLLLITLFLASTIFLIAFNVQSLVLHANAKQNHDLELAELKREEEKAKQLDVLERNHKRLESEFAMLEEGLKSLYIRKCNSIDDFIPIDDQHVVHCKIENFRRTLGLLMSAGISVTSKDNSHAFNVPKTGCCQLAVEAFTIDHQSALLGKPDHELVFSKAIKLQNGQCHKLELSVLDDKVSISLTGHDDVEVVFPAGNGRYKHSFSLDKHVNRVVSCPNQFDHSRKIDQEPRATPIASYMFRPNMNGELFNIQLTVTSDGPLVSLPDDIYVVRKLLDDFKAGIYTKFKLNERGWYEFAEN